VFEIFAETHKIIASNIYDNIFNIYGLKLDKEKLLWGSIAPDYLPQFKLIRHYKEESLQFIVNEILKIIFLSRLSDIHNSKCDPLTVKLFSKKIGIISHYLSDYTCFPHANRWTFTDCMIKHIKYENNLGNIAQNHTFKRNIIDTDDIDVSNEGLISIRKKIIDFIGSVVEEYSISNHSYSNDLNFAMSLNLKITYFILDTIEVYSNEISTNGIVLVI